MCGRGEGVAALPWRIAASAESSVPLCPFQVCQVTSNQLCSHGVDTQTHAGTMAATEEAPRQLNAVRNWVSHHSYSVACPRNVGSMCKRLTNNECRWIFAVRRNGTLSEQGEWRRC